MQCNALHCAACLILHCTALHFAALHYTALPCTAMHCTTMQCTALVWLIKLPVLCHITCGRDLFQIDSCAMVVNYIWNMVPYWTGQYCFISFLGENFTELKEQEEEINSGIRRNKQGQEQT